MLLLLERLLLVASLVLALPIIVTDGAAQQIVVAPVEASTHSCHGYPETRTTPSPAPVVAGTPTIAASPTATESTGQGVGTVIGTLEEQCGNSPFAGCQGPPVPNAAVLVRDDQGALVARVITDRSGSFRVDVPAGHYVVQDAESGVTAPVEVTAGQVTMVGLIAPR